MCGCDGPELRSDFRVKYLGFFRCSGGLVHTSGLFLGRLSFVYGR